MRWIEPRLRDLLPADLYAEVWVASSIYDSDEHDKDSFEHKDLVNQLTRVFEHLRTMQRILHDYVPRQVLDNLGVPGEVKAQWEKGTLMFTDLSGFTPLMEANADRGRAGASALLGVLNKYFSQMIELISKSGGNLLEFTGDALLAQFVPDQREQDALQAVRAGLRMQRIMTEMFEEIDVDGEAFSLGQRIGIHTGDFLTADIGTPKRMEHVLLGKTVQDTKRAEGAGVVARVNATEAVYERIKDTFTLEENEEPGYWLVIDDLSDEDLGEYDLVAPAGRRQRAAVLFDKSPEGLITEIEQLIEQVEPVACYIPDPILHILIESAAQREIAPDLPMSTVMFVNLMGLPEAVDEATEEEIETIVDRFSRAVALVNAAVESRGGVLKKVTYHLTGSDMMMFFGVPTSHTDDSARAANAALAIRDIIMSIEPPTVGGRELQIECQIGLTRGRAFAAEIGELRGRREFNVIGDAVNTCARLMGRALGNRILMTKDVYEDIHELYDEGIYVNKDVRGESKLHKVSLKSLGPMKFKGKSERISVYSLEEKVVEVDE